MAVGTTGSVLAGRYRILRALGWGGMAAVYLCGDERLGRLVAVKRLYAPSAEDVEARFTREAKLGASLNHPNLVSVYDTATDGESVLIVMEYVDGETLREALGRGPLEPHRTLAIVLDVAAALDHAHAHGVVHRDVKPGNILLRDDGVAKLVDLGIALAADSTRITRSGIVLGTASYMAPEQLDGRSSGPEADVYALAAVAFEALAGRKAWPGRTPIEVAHRIATQPAPDLCEAWPKAPPAASEALCRGMARDPGDRQPSAGQLADELERAFTAVDERPAHRRRRAGERARSPQPAPRRRPDEAPSLVDRAAAERRLAPLPPAGVSARPRSHPLVAALLAVAALLLAGGAAVVLLRNGGGADRAAERSQRSGQAQQERKRRSTPQRESRGGSEEPAPGGVTPRVGPSQGGVGQAGQGGPQPTGQSGTAVGARLNDEGYALLQGGRYEDAVSVLRRSVSAFPPGTTDINYAYALFNLGRALRLAGRPAEAVPILERRLRIPNQTATVRRELEAARAAARRG